MYYCWQISIYSSYCPEIKEWLEKKYHLSCTPGYNMNDQLSSIHFDLEEAHPNFQEIHDSLPWHWKGRHPLEYKDHIFVLYFPVYSEEDYRSAKWLSVRCSFSKVRINPRNFDENLEYRCPIQVNGVETGMHFVAKQPYRSYSSVKWNRHFIASAENSEHILFCNDLLRDIMISHDIKGAEFLPVYYKKSEQLMEDLYLLSATYTVPNGAIVGIKNFKSIECKQCGMKMLTMTDQRWKYGILENSIPDDLDICRTLPLFLGRDSDRNSGAEIFISQRFFRLLRGNKMDKSLWFTPLDMVTV